MALKEPFEALETIHDKKSSKSETSMISLTPIISENDLQRGCSPLLAPKVEPFFIPSPNNHFSQFQQKIEPESQSFSTPRSLMKADFPDELPAQKGLSEMSLLSSALSSAPAAPIWLPDLPKPSSFRPAKRKKRGLKAGITSNVKKNIRRTEGLANRLEQLRGALFRKLGFPGGRGRLLLSTPHRLFGQGVPENCLLGLGAGAEVPLGQEDSQKTLQISEIPRVEDLQTLAGCNYRLIWRDFCVEGSSEDFQALRRTQHFLMCFPEGILADFRLASSSPLLEEPPMFRLLGLEVFAAAVPEEAEAALLGEWKSQLTELIQSSGTPTQLNSFFVRAHCSLQELLASRKSLHSSAPPGGQVCSGKEGTENRELRYLPTPSSML